MVSESFSVVTGISAVRFVSSPNSLVKDVVTIKKISMIKMMSSIGVMLISASSALRRFFLTRTPPAIHQHDADARLLDKGSCHNKEDEHDEDNIQHRRDIDVHVVFQLVSTY